MPVTYCADPARLIKIAFVKETVTGDFLQPSAANGGVSVPHSGVVWGRGQIPIDGVAATGNSQHVIKHRSIRGIDNPFLTVRFPFGPATKDLVAQLITGSPLTTGEYPISDFPDSWSISVRIARAAGAGESTFNFLACYMESTQLVVPVGGEAFIAMTLRATQQIDPQSATAYPTDLTIDGTKGPYVLRQVDWKMSADAVFNENPIPVEDITFNWGRQLIVKHTSTRTEPQCIVPTTFNLNGQVQHYLSKDLWEDAVNGFQDVIAKEADGGFVVRFVETLLVAAGDICRMTMPVTLDIPQLDGSDLEADITTPISFVAGADDAVEPPTNPTIRLAVA